MTRYSYPGAPPGERESSALSALIRSWAVGIVVLVVTEYLQMSLLNAPLVGDDGPGSFGSALLLVHLPNAVCLALATWTAARLHRTPYRAHLGQHLTAALAIPVAAQLLTLSMQWDRMGGFGGITFWMSNAVVVTGCAVGLALARLGRDS
ncbi:hypothetical protein [Streptomyces hundungensis]|uniref:hypothetical protein n=1 Tax=Streptomyces hundungensis TaxID=1077946 RepID=UPI0033FAE536